MAYIPPWKRKENAALAEDKSQDLPPDHKGPGGRRFQLNPSAYVASDILCHYFPNAREDAQPDRNGVVCIQRATMNGSAEKPKDLVFILLHTNANPQFYTEGLVYVKSQLYLLNAWRTKKNATQTGKGITLDEFTKGLGISHDQSDHTRDEKGGTAMDDHPQKYPTDINDPASSDRTADGDHDDAGATATSPFRNSDSLLGESKHASESTANSQSITASEFITSQPTDSPLNGSDLEDTKKSPDTTAIESAGSGGYHVAVYDQVGRGRGNKDGDTFRFIGYHKVVSVDFCPPHSKKLKDLLQHKWTWKDRHGNEVAKQRDISKWQESFKWEWAEIKLEKDDEYEKQVGPPQIERHTSIAGTGARPEDAGKSVNDLLNEMRSENNDE